MRIRHYQRVTIDSGDRLIGTYDCRSCRRSETYRVDMWNLRDSRPCDFCGHIERTNS